MLAQRKFEDERLERVKKKFQQSGLSQFITFALSLL